MSYETLNPPGSKERLDGGWTYVDVRTVEEFEAGHAPGAFTPVLVVLGRLREGRVGEEPREVEDVREGDFGEAVLR